MMILTAVCLGALPSIGGSFICTAVGYVTQATGHATCFFKILLAYYLSSGLAIGLGNSNDAWFDAQFSTRKTYRFRIYVPAAMLIVLLPLAGRWMTQLPEEPTMEMVLLLCLCVAGVGFFCGVLVVTGTVIVGSLPYQSRESLVLSWIGVACAGLACIVAQWVTGFGPFAAPSEVHAFFDCGALLSALCLAICAALDWSGAWEQAFDRTAEEEEPLQVAAPRGRGPMWSPAIQGGNAAITVFLFPLLPLVHCRNLATTLVLWKLFMDFVGPVLMLCWRCPWPFAGTAGLISTRVALLAVVLYLIPRSADFKIPLIIAWNLLMLCGSVLTCAMDRLLEGSSAQPAAPEALAAAVAADTADVPIVEGSADDGDAKPPLTWLSRVRANRLAHQLGIVVGLVSAGIVVYAAAGNGGVVQATELRCRGLPPCAAPSAALAGTQHWPCGGGGGGSGAAVGGAGRGRDSVRIFHYGANMGCAKLEALGIYPLAATPARAAGFRLSFGSSPGFPTSAQEPAFGGLLPCGDGGCVHGVVHELTRRDLAKLSATEPGYALGELPDVTAYHGEPLRGVLAYLPTGALVAEAPSRRYAGLVWCQANASLAPGYSRQLACELAGLGIDGLSCAQENFQPLVAQSQSFLGVFRRSAGRT